MPESFGDDAIEVDWNQPFLEIECGEAAFFRLRQAIGEAAGGEELPCPDHELGSLVVDWNPPKSPEETAGINAANDRTWNIATWAIVVGWCLLPFLFYTGLRVIYLWLQG